MKKIRKVCLLLMIASLIFSSCTEEKNNIENNSKDENAIQAISYSNNEFELSDISGEIKSNFIINNNLFILENVDIENKIYKVDLNNFKTEVILSKSMMEDNVLSVCNYGNNILTLSYKLNYSGVQDVSIENENSDMDEFFQNIKPSMSIDEYDINGNLINSNLLDDENIQTVVSTYASNFGQFDAKMYIDKNSYKYIVIEEKIYVYDENFKFKSIINIPEDMSISKFIISNENHISVIFSENTVGQYKLYMGDIDVEKSIIQKQEELNDEEIFNGYGDYKFIKKKNNKIYGVNKDDKIILDLAQNYLNTNIYDFSFIDDKTILIMYLEDEKPTICILNRSENAVKDKEEIVLAVSNVDLEINKIINDFNKANNSYNVVLKEYPVEDYATNLYKDYVSGNIPDMMFINNDIPFQNFCSKNMFEDIYTFIDRDKDLNREDFFEGVLKAFEFKNGSLYSMPTGFGIKTYAVKSKFVNNSSIWTINNLNDIMSSQGSDAQFMVSLDRIQLFKEFIYFNINEYIDFEKGECYFENESFVKLLELFKNYKFDENDDVKYKNAEYIEGYKNDKIIMKRKDIQNLFFMKELEVDFEDEFSLVGVPSVEGEGSSVICPGFEISIFQKSKNKDASWEFIKHFLSEKYQNTKLDTFPIIKNSLFSRIETQNQINVFVDENGKTVEYASKYINGNYFGQLSQNEIDDSLEFISSINNVYREDMKLNKIFEEELLNYFDLGNSAERTAELLQNKISLYVAEIK
jgi:ABC-type glycerol-3-phosphate transport system substrate-binding protein